MNEIVKKDILSIISKTIEILKVKEESDILDLKKLSNHTVHNTSVFQDEDSVSIAILIYSLSKTIERKFREINFDEISEMLNSSYQYLKKGKIAEYRRSMKKIFTFISNIDTKLKLYIEEVIRQAQIKKGGQVYRHGISVERAAEILGISQWELMNYIGHTRMTEVTSEALDIKSRLEFTRRLFS